MKIQNDQGLLSRLMSEFASAPAPWRITAYWQDYSDRILEELGSRGLEDALQNYRLLKGYADGGVPVVIGPIAPWKKRVFFGLAGLPGVNKVIAEYERLLSAVHAQRLRAETNLAELCLAQMDAETPNSEAVPNITSGNPEILIPWRGGQVPLRMVQYLARTHDFYQSIADNTVDSLVEIGAGLGFSTLSHRLLNRNIGLFVNIDIPTTLYVAGQYLKSTELFNFIDYETLPAGRIVLDDFPRDPRKPTLICIPPWRAQDIDGTVSWSHNAYSFQEMEASVVEAYAAVLSNSVQAGHWFLSSLAGHKPGAGGQLAPVSHQTIRAAFPNCETMLDLEMRTSQRYWNADPRCSIVLKANT